MSLSELLNTNIDSKPWSDIFVDSITTNSFIDNGSATFNGLVSFPGGITGATGSFTSLLASSQSKLSGGVTGGTGSFSFLLASSLASLSGGVTGGTASFSSLVASGLASLSGGVTGTNGSFVNLTSSDELTVGNDLKYGTLVTSTVIGANDVDTVIHFIKQVASIPDNVSTPYLSFSVPNNTYQMIIEVKANVVSLPNSKACSSITNMWSLSRVTGATATLTAATYSNYVQSDTAILDLAISNASSVSGGASASNACTLNITVDAKGTETASYGLFEISITSLFAGGADITFT